MGAVPVERNRILYFTRHSRDVDVDSETLEALHEFIIEVGDRLRFERNVFDTAITGYSLSEVIARTVGCRACLACTNDLKRGEFQNELKRVRTLADLLCDLSCAAGTEAAAGVFSFALRTVFSLLAPACLRPKQALRSGVV